MAFYHNYRNASKNYVLQNALLAHNQKRRKIYDAKNQKQ